VTIIVIINSEGKVSENYYLIDGMTMGTQKFLSIYIIEHEGMRLMIDVGETLKSRKIIKKIKDFGLYPIDKIVISHSHWDHAQGIAKLINSMKDIEVEVLAAENAIDNLRHPERMMKGYEGMGDVYPFEGEITPLKEGDIIDINGLKLEVMNFFGHTMDSIALLDKVNRNIFVGDSIIMRLDENAFFIPLMPPDFNEEELLNTFNKLRAIKDDFNSIFISHFGVWTDNHFKQIINEMEELYFKAKNLLINLYNENPSVEYITNKYFETLTPKSTFWNEKGFEFFINMMIEGLKYSGFIEEKIISH
jgi:glyoxylase-like metal-dependent hydrolase (beta-lactamase superfamily II)